MEHYDIKKARRELYAPKHGVFTLVDVPELWFLKVDGHGDPNTAQQYREALEALYPLSYAIRKICKATLGRVHTVSPLEGIWWAQDMSTFASRQKDDWDWSMMIAQPEYVTGDIVSEAHEAVRPKAPVALDRVRFEPHTDGLSVQTLHIGSYDDEGPVLQRMHEEYIPSKGLTMTGRHHEIYLSDARKTAPEKLRTILRQPVKRL
ncbi:MAG: GyrI-like domain-containing protein [Gulosibacter sp.]|uniref:GyrI-like domain-containing protein n=1 Tax=Gulosibacter sp. TaxID=2817531 RepID=UPI003F90008D